MEGPQPGKETTELGEDHDAQGASPVTEPSQVCWKAKTFT